MLSATNTTLRGMAIDRDSSAKVPHTPLLEDTLQHVLTLLFLRELDYHRSVEEIKSDLRQRRDYSTRKFFQIIDTGRPKTKIDRYEIRDFVEDNLRLLADHELDAIIRR